MTHNFSFWRPTPIIKTVDQQTISNLYNPNSPENGSYEEYDPYVVNFSSKTISSTSGPGGSYSYQYFSTSYIGNGGEFISITNTSSRRIGIASADSTSDLYNFISSKSTFDLESLGYSGNDSGVSYEHDIDNTEYIGKYIYNDYFIVYDIDTVNSSSYGFNYEMNSTGDVEPGSPLSSPYSSSDSDFRLYSDFNPSTYSTTNFDYSPTLRVDRNIEDTLGSVFNVTQISVNYFTVDKDGFFVETFSDTTNTVTVDYNNVEDRYYVYPTFPFYIEPSIFQEMLAVITYNSNAGNIIRHQTIRMYGSNYRFAFKENELYTPGNFINFYVPLWNEELKFVNELTSGIYDSSSNNLNGLITSKISSLIPINGATNINYTTTTGRINQVRLVLPSGNNQLLCGGLGQNSGNSGSYNFDVSLPAISGMVKLSYMHYLIPDRIRFELPVSNTKYDSNNLVSGGNEVYIFKTSTSSQVARINVNAPFFDTAWINSVDCPKTFTPITSGSSFIVDSIYTDDIIKLSQGDVYVKAISGQDYILEYSINDTENQYNALKDLLIINQDNDRIRADLTPVEIYQDPYSGNPVYHIKWKFNYPNKNIIGNDENNINSGEIRINQAYLADSSISSADITTKKSRYKSAICVDPYNTISNGTISYVPKLIVPIIAGKVPFTYIGSLEYTLENQKYNQSFFVKKSSPPVPMVDLLGYLFQSFDADSRYGNNFSWHQKQLEKYRGIDISTSPLPMTVDTSGNGYFFENMGVSNEIISPMSQPFFNTTVGMKYLRLKLLISPSLPVTIGEIGFSILDSTNGNITHYVENVNSNLSLYIQFNGYTAEAINFRIFNCPSERATFDITVFEELASLNIGQSATLNSIPSANIFGLKASTPSYTFVNASIGVDYTVSGDNYTSNINGLKLIRLVTSNPQLPPTTQYALP